MKIKNWQIVLLLLALLFAIGSFVWYQTTLRDREVEASDSDTVRSSSGVGNMGAPAPAVQEVKPGKSIAERCDSLYHNFTTPALNFAQVKGFVKSIKPASGSDYPFEIYFDRDGNIINVKVRFIPDASYGIPPELTCYVSKNSEGVPTSISYATTIAGMYPLEATYRFGLYSGTNRISSISQKYAYMESSGNITETYSDFNDSNLPTKVVFSSEEFEEGTEYKSRATLNRTYGGFDSFGNWTKCNETGVRNILVSEDGAEYGPDAGVEDSYSETENVNFNNSRVIEYYSPDELNLQSRLGY